MNPNDFAQLAADLEAAKADYLEKDAARNAAQARLTDLTEQFEVAVFEFRERNGIDPPAPSPVITVRETAAAALEARRAPQPEPNGPEGREIGAPFHAADWCRPDEFESIKPNLDAALEEAARDNGIVFGPVGYETREPGNIGAEDPPGPDMVLGVATAHVEEVLPL